MRNNVTPLDLKLDDEKHPYLIMSAYRTLEILKAFAQAPHKFSLSDLTKLMGIEKNQLYRSLKTLEHAEFLRMEADGRFVLTAIIQELSVATTQPKEKSLVEIAQPYLDELVSKTNETVNLFVRSGDLAVCVDRRDSPQPVKLTSALGLSVALHAGAVPKAILAQLDKETQELTLKHLANLPSYTPKTVLSIEKLRQELVVIKTRGYSISDEDYDASARGVGAAIFDASNEVIAGISVGGPSFRVDDEKLKEFSQLIMHIANKISKHMGYLDKTYLGGKE